VFRHPPGQEKAVFDLARWEWLLLGVVAIVCVLLVWQFVGPKS
jgi:hypothetical protein